MSGNAFYCDRYQISPDGTKARIRRRICQMRTPADWSKRIEHLYRSSKMCHSMQVNIVYTTANGTYPECADQIYTFDNFSQAPSNVEGVDTFNIIGSTEVPECP